jgi:hypothetical protein
MGAYQSGLSKETISLLSHPQGGPPEPHKKTRGQAMHTTTHHNGAKA